MANELSSQKYTNNQRSVSGTPTIYRDDVTLNCLTASAAVTINLLEVPANHWMTTWELLVVDYSSNAATNNITITAPSGFKINGAQSITISANGGSALIKIVNNTNFIATTSAGSGGSSVTGASNVGVGTGSSFKQLSGTTLQFRTLLQGAGITISTGTDEVTISATPVYVYALKALQTAGTYYSAVAAGVRSVVSGANAGAFDSKVEAGITGFDISTGVWTVGSSGYFTVGAKMTTRINATDVDAYQDGGGLAWMTNPIPDGQGFIAIAIVIQRVVLGSLKTLVVCSDKQLINQSVSDVNIECTSVEYPFLAGDLVSVKVLNKTDHGIVGIANSASLPDCYLDFSVKQ